MKKELDLIKNELYKMEKIMDEIFPIETSKREVIKYQKDLKESCNRIIEFIPKLEFNQEIKKWAEKLNVSLEYDLFNKDKIFAQSLKDNVEQKRHAVLMTLNNLENYYKGKEDKIYKLGLDISKASDYDLELCAKDIKACREKIRNTFNRI